MEIEAMRIAKEWADSTGNMGFICRAFLAQQARLAEVERERDGYRLDAVRAASAHLDTLGKLAAAERKATEAAREALTRFVKERREGTASNDQWDMLCDLERFRDREYPAVPTEREGAGCADVPERCVSAPSGVCVRAHNECGMHCGDKQARPTPPQAAPEPLMFGTRKWNEPDAAGDVYVRLTPDDCRRIVETGRASGGGE